MPRGYLKNQKDSTSRKMARGGSSKRNRNEKNHNYNNKTCFGSATCGGGSLSYYDRLDAADYDYEYEHNKFDDDILYCQEIQKTNFPKKNATTTHVVTTTTTTTTTTIGDCPICLETSPLFHLVKACKHPKSCFDCLRQLYITHSINNVTNFPITCYFPGCKNKLTSSHIAKLEPTKQEMTQYYKMTTLAKAYQSRRRAVAHCPGCDFPRQFVISNNKKNSWSERVINCYNCHDIYYCINDGYSLSCIILDHETVQAVEAMGGGWAICPSCHLMVSGGDYDGYVEDEKENDDPFDFCVQCNCERKFHWGQAKQRVKRISAHARCGI